jgi:DNA-binding HxlR family transcriptional regulator
MKNESTKPPRSIEKRMAELERRVRRIEQGDRAVSPTAPSRGHQNAPGRLWVTPVLEKRSGPPFEGHDARGSIVYAGSVATAGISSILWEVERPLPPMLEATWDTAASVLAALGHPVRLRIIRHLLRGARSSQELLEIEGIGTTGRLYHHLRELELCGLIVSPTRNEYVVPPQKVVPCLVVIAAAGELSQSGISNTSSTGGDDDAS